MHQPINKKREEPGCVQTRCADRNHRDDAFPFPADKETRQEAKQRNPNEGL